MNKPATSAAEYLEATHDANKQRELHPSDCGAIALDAFCALPRDEQRRTWTTASEADRLGLVLQTIRRGNHGPDAANIALYTRLYEDKFGSDLSIPTVEDICAVVKDRYDLAVQHEDYAGAGQLDRVRVNLGRGARLSWSMGDLLVQSVNNPGQVYSVSRAGCTCPNGRAGKSECWHCCLFDLLLDMQDERAATADMEADRAADAAAWAEHEAEQRLWTRIAAVRTKYVA